jgi:phosphoribosylaminoimidazole-succinocarboxamide synthase
VIEPPIVEFYLKDDALGDPLMTTDRIALLQVASPDEVAQLRSLAQQINQVLRPFFDQCGITLVDFKLEFGLDRQGQMILADEISPDTCRFWQQGEPDSEKRVLDKDRFRQDLGNIEDAYQQVLNRVLGQAV